MTQLCCSKCMQHKNKEDFNIRRDVPRGYSSHCKECKADARSRRASEKSQYDKNYRVINADRISKQRKIRHDANADLIREKRSSYREKNRQKIRKYDNERSLTIRARAMKIFSSARMSAPKRGLSFTIDFNMVHILLIQGTCARSGLKFDLKPHTSRVNPFAPSLDRKDNNIGYEPNNIQLVCNMYNLGKGDFDQIDFLAMCVEVARLNGSNVDVINRLKELKCTK